MKREFLQELKLEEETIAKIMVEHGKTVNSVKEKLQAKEEYLTVMTGGDLIISLLTPFKGEPL